MEGLSPEAKQLVLEWRRYEIKEDLAWSQALLLKYMFFANDVRLTRAKLWGNAGLIRTLTVQSIMLDSAYYGYFHYTIAQNKKTDVLEEKLYYEHNFTLEDYMRIYHN